jgi:hypothetical protein
MTILIMLESKQITFSLGFWIVIGGTYFKTVEHSDLHMLLCSILDK